MITILKESEVKGRPAFIPSAQNLKELSDTALEMTMDNADRLDEIKASIDVLMMSIAELQEARDAEEALDNTEEPKEEEPTGDPIETDKGEDVNVKDKN